MADARIDLFNTAGAAENRNGNPTDPFAGAYPTTDEPTEVRDSWSAWDYAIFPLFAHRPLPDWEGLRWNLVDQQIGNGEFVAIVVRATTNRTSMAAQFYGPWSTHKTPAQVRSWFAFVAWSKWAAAVSPGHVVDPNSFILSSYPRSPWQVPREWLKAAKDEGVSWGEWKGVCELLHRDLPTRRQDDGSRRLIPPTKESFLPALRYLRAARAAAAGEADPDSGERRRGRRAIELPPRWVEALELMSTAFKDTTIRAYRSQIRAVLAATGSPDPEACRSMAARMGSTRSTAWRAFHEYLKRVEADGAGPVPGDGAATPTDGFRWKGRVLDLHARCPFADKFFAEIAEEARRRQSRS